MLVNDSAQGNDQGMAPEDALTARETLLAKALQDVLVAAGMLDPNVPVSPVELLAASEAYVEYASHADVPQNRNEPEQGGA